MGSHPHPRPHDSSLAPKFLFVPLHLPFPVPRPPFPRLFATRVAFRLEEGEGRPGLPSSVCSRDWGLSEVKGTLLPFLSQRSARYLLTPAAQCGCDTKQLLRGIRQRLVFLTRQKRDDTKEVFLAGLRGCGLNQHVSQKGAKYFPAGNPWKTEFYHKRIYQRKKSECFFMSRYNAGKVSK